MTIYRQGDVLLKTTKTIPKTAIKKNNTVAFGETTGHHHTFDSGAQVYADQEQQYVVIEKESVLAHQEHDSITVPEGKYVVVIQREFDLVDGVRKVMD